MLHGDVIFARECLSDFLILEEDNMIKDSTFHLVLDL
jgi:hypothetical protein